MNLLKKIETREAVVSIIGLGYVGLPLAVSFAEAGFHVIGIDINEKRVKAVNRGESYITDIDNATVAAVVARDSREDGLVDVRHGSEVGERLYPARVLARQHAKGLSATTDFDALNDADVAIICVPTPLDKTRSPDISYIVAATEEIGQRLRRDMLIILESTTYPGTTTEVVRPLLEEVALPSTKHGRNGQGPANYPLGNLASLDIGRFEAGRDFYLAFSPERVDPGRTDYTVRTTPKVIGGVTPKCTKRAEFLYSQIIDHIVPVSSPEVAEMSKILENTFRAVNIAMVNEMAIMCDTLGIDVWEVIDAAKTKPYGFMPFYPGPGIGGHCIPVDPEYLAWKLRTLCYNARFIQLATEINCNMPQYVLGRIADALNTQGKPISGRKVLVLGVTYKADVNDMRESPALDLIKLLHAKGAAVAYHDPYLPRLEVNGLTLSSEILTQRILKAADCVVIESAHSSYDWQWVVDNSQLVIDTRNATKGVTTSLARIVKL